MHKIKQLPEDFIVEEESTIKPGSSGKYTYFILRKKNYTTEKAIHMIAGYLKIPRKSFGCAGNKDKRAITTQLCSAFGMLKPVKLQDIETKTIGYGNIPVSLGDLCCNKFTITVRNITEKPRKIRKIINYFGEQRFSNDNAEIGKCIIKAEFRKAAELIAAHKGDFEEKVIEYIEKNKNDSIGAIRQLPKKIIMLYLHAYQSKLWNETANQLEKSKKNLMIPIIGFGTEIEDKKIKGIITKIMKKESIGYRDFIVRQLPELSLEGGERSLFAEVQELEIAKLEEDELNNGKKKTTIKFKLQKGSYATEVIKALF